MENEDGEGAKLRRSERVPLPTEKGRTYQFSVLTEKKNDCVTSLVRASKKIISSLATADVSTIRSEHSRWLELYESYLVAVEKCLELITDEDEVENFKKEHETNNSKFLEIKGSVEGWLIKRAPATPRPPSVRSAKSKQKSLSGLSRASSGLGAILLAKAEEEQKKAELLIKSQALNETKQIEEERLKLRFREKELQLKTEIKTSEAKTKILAELERSEREDEQELDNWVNYTMHPQPDDTMQPPPDDNVKDLETLLDGININSVSNLHPITSTPFPDRLKTMPVHVNTRNSESLQSVARELRKPTCDIKKFDGNILEYKSFLRQFETRICANTESLDERINYLLQFTTGEAHKLVVGYSHLDSKVGYKAVLDEFESRYGDPHVVTQAYISKALNWPWIKNDDVKSLDQFAIFLRECQFAAEEVGSLQVLEYGENLKSLVQKLPFYLHDRWRNIVYETRARKQSVRFSQFVDFVRKESKKANDPTFGRGIMSSSLPNHSKANHSQGGGGVKSFRKNFAANAVPGPVKRDMKSSISNSGVSSSGISSSGVFNSGVSSCTTNTVPGDGGNGTAFSKPCQFCHGNSHALTDCWNIMKSSLKDRYAFLKTKSVCFACLRIGCRKDSCQKKLQCSLCKRPHPTILHVDSLFSKPEVTSGATSDMGAGDSTVALAVVPVKVRAANSQECCLTYAFLDSGSTASFCTNRLLETLHVKGKKMTYSLHTMAGEKIVDSQSVAGLEVCDLEEEDWIKLPRVLSQDELPVSEHDIVSPDSLKKWPYLSEIPVNRINSGVDLLIGANVPKAMEPWEIVPSVGNGPFAIRTALGWVINGPLGSSADADQESIAAVRVNFTDMHPVCPGVDDLLSEQLKQYFNHDFSERLSEDKLEFSVEDQKFMKQVQGSIRKQDGHYVIGMPFRNDDTRMPNNRNQALQRLNHLKKKLDGDENFLTEYSAFMDNMFSKGYAVRVPEGNIPEKGKVWYIPHHGVFHPRKGKLRVVFDCATRCAGTSLNDQLLSGPNLTNTLLGTLMRFREENIAFMGDIESMFYQVRVPDQDKNFLRFLWFQDNDTQKDVVEYYMQVHLFGAASSPSCSNFALQTTAQEAKGSFNDEVIDTVLRNFYVDDCVKSTNTVERAVTLIQDLQSLLKEGGFHIAKWVSSNRDVMNTIPVSERSQKFMNLDLDTLPVDHALGIQWDTESDAFCFKMLLKDQPPTRRGILSTVSSVFDPLGFLSPFLLQGKIILQDLCKMKLGWDTPIPDKQKADWGNWLEDAKLLAAFSMARCIKPENFGSVRSSQLHTFSDASESGYGIVSYLRLEDEFDNIHCSFIMGKSRVTPLKQITIPRLELSAATVAVKSDRLIRRELDIPIDKSVFWCDSMSVLRYIWNTSSRFHTFVANRLAVIHDGSSLDDWHYIRSQDNQADMASRGAGARDFLDSSTWIHGPEFLWKRESEWAEHPEQKDDEELPPDDPEVKCFTVLSKESVSIDTMINRYSSWYFLKRAVAWIRRIGKVLLHKVRAKRENKENSASIFKGDNFTANELQEAEEAILSYVQRKAFSQEILSLEQGKPVSRQSYLRKLDPFMKDGLLRVGGRLHRSDLPMSSKHPILLPKDSRVSILILRNVHIAVGHSGRNHMLARLREGYWVINAPSAIRKLLSKCVVCRRFRGRLGEQKMSSLPKDRVTPDEPPFTRVGCDYFGPFEVKQRRSYVKRYGVIFTCLASRAVHLEIAYQLDTDSCINALRRFIARRGTVIKIWSDNGTNLKGAERELKESIQQWNISQIQNAMLQRGIDWQFNPPAGSHFGGVWERVIREVRKVLNSVLQQQTLNDESMHTLFCEIEAILNGRPITLPSDHPSDLEPLTPNHLLHMKGQVNLPPGIFVATDNYVKRRWRQIQYMSDLFWRRWIKEYLPLLQERQKWFKERRNLRVGDVVLICDPSAPRNFWPLAVVTETMPDSKGQVRQVKVKTKSNTLIRPVDKLCSLLELDGE